MVNLNYNIFKKLINIFFHKYLANNNIISMEPNKEQIIEEDKENSTNLNEMYLNEALLKRSNSFTSFVNMLNEKKEEEEEGDGKNEKKN